MATLAATVLVSRHGQRSPYPLPHDTSAAGPSIWSDRPWPSAAEWGMSDEEFAHQMLTPNGKAQLRNVGAYMASQLGDPCSLAVTLIADDSTRDVQSAESFADGFLPPACRAELGRVSVCNTTEMQAVGSDHAHAVECAGPDEAETLREFGGNFDALTDLYRPQMRLLDQLVGCCSAEACAAYGLEGGRCRLEDLPYAFDGTYYNGFFAGPLQVAGAMASALMLQELSGLQAGWGNLSLAELTALYRTHERVMWLGSRLNSSRAFGSHQLAYILASFEQQARAARARARAHRCRWRHRREARAARRADRAHGLPGRAPAAVGAAAVRGDLRARLQPALPAHAAARALAHRVVAVRRRDDGGARLLRALARRRRHRRRGLVRAPPAPPAARPPAASLLSTPRPDRRGRRPRPRPCPRPRPRPARAPPAPAPAPRPGARPPARGPRRRRCARRAPAAWWACWSRAT